MNMAKYLRSAGLLIASLLLLNIFTVSASAEIQNNVIPPGEKLEVIYNQGTHLEGPAVAPDGQVYFCDLTPSSLAKGVLFGGHIMKYDPKTKKITVFRSPSGQADGLAFDAVGRLIAAEAADYGGRRITATDLETGKAIILAAEFDDQPLNSPNDVVTDNTGNIYFTDPRYFGKEAMNQAVQGVYRIDRDGKISLIIGNAGKPNGIALSPDQKTLYIDSNDNGLFDYRSSTAGLTPRRGFDGILAYDLLEDGTAKFREIIYQSPGFKPDGMRVDVDGNIFVANYDPSHPGILVLSPKGKEIGYIQTPETTTNCEFGIGAESNVLFITSNKALYKIVTTHQGEKKSYQ